MSSLKLADLMPPIFWQIVIALVIFSSSAAGYYSGQSYSDFMNKGWYSVASVDDVLNPLSIIGTIGSIVCVGVFILRPPIRLPSLILIILPVQLWLVISSLWSNTFYSTIVFTLKTLIYVNALDCALSRLDARTAMKAFGWSIAAILIVSLILCLNDPIFRMSI
ncbi:MAG: hypothetical protein EOO38_06255, partial [Cytophagaceae bacterium]